MAKHEPRNQQVGSVFKMTAAMLLIIVAGLVWWYFRVPLKARGMQEFFSDDDGTTWFADDGTKIAPFDHNGKTAVLAKVYETANGKQFVAYLMKFTDKAHDDAIYSQKTHLPRGGPASASGTADNGLLVKKPHDKDWIPANDTRSRGVMTVKCPDGSTDYNLVRPQD